MNKTLVTQEVLPFFQRAAAQTYAANAPKSTVTALPGSKVYRVAEDPWLYVDVYYTGEDGWSSGSTLIAYHDRPIWTMSYMGQCVGNDKVVTVFLREVLRYAYTSPMGMESVNGRGPYYYERRDGRDLIYCNRVEVSGFYRYFKGRETIYDETSATPLEVFWHEYQGGLLAGV